MAGTALSRDDDDGDLDPRSLGIGREPFVSLAIKNATAIVRRLVASLAMGLSADVGKRFSTSDFW